MSSILKRLSGEADSTRSTGSQKEERIVESVFSQKKPQEVRETVIGTDANFKGDLKFKNKMIIDGKVEGNIESSGLLIIGKDAEVKAEIKTGNIVIAGRVYGNVSAAEKVELQTTAKLFGDIQASRLTVADGVTFVGKSDVDPSRERSVSAQLPAEEKFVVKPKEADKTLFPQQKEDTSKKTLV